MLDASVAKCYTSWSGLYFLEMGIATLVQTKQRMDQPAHSLLAGQSRWFGKELIYSLEFVNHTGDDLETTPPEIRVGDIDAGLF